ncbi:AGE family epimerase/isomerase [Gorillibacterium sp. sgz5001074]|uniref:AGE family epimerase/isomerase n=1 Tax=Gorillibacterium sp. sgz5001074 TaxID=3446695 RepID=UPI003F6703C2
MKPAELKQEMSAELDRILHFWMNHTVDPVHGGFHGRVECDLTTDPSAPKGLVLNARILWTFSRAYRNDPQPRYLEMAERALAYIERVFRDPEYGGYYWLVAPDGSPIQSKKMTYGHAFYLYGAAEYILASGRTELLPLTEELFALVERSFDPIRSGYVEAFARNWTEEGDLRLGDQDPNDKKSMNTHLHVLEAYTQYYRVRPTPVLAERLRRILTDMLERIIDPATGHFSLFFDEDWHVKSNLISYGHDIEGSWLLMEAAHVLGDAELKDRAAQAALRMADASLVRGVDSDGAMMWDGNMEGILDSDKHWWVQAEAVVGFVNAWQMSGEARFWDAAIGCWRFIRSHLITPSGEWYWKTDRSGRPSHAEGLVNMWKCPYHNARACFEIIERL